MRVPARGVAALMPAIRFGVLLLSTVAQPLAALPPYGCGTPLAAAALPILQKCAVIIVYQSTPQCGERSNAAFGKQSAAGQTSLAPHDSKARLISVTTCRRFMAKPCTPHPHCAARAALQAANPQWRGQGAAPLAFSWGSKGDILSRERISPFSRAAPTALLSSSAQCAEKYKKEHPYGCSFSNC